MFGNPTLATWGTSQWGTILVIPSTEVQIDSVAQSTEDRSCAIDSVNGLFDEERSASLDSVASAESGAMVAIDYAPTPLAQEIWANEEIQPYVLAELELPGGTVRLSSQCVTALGSVWDERIVNVSDVLRTVGRGTADFSLELDDTSTDGQERFRDVFSANDPEGSVVRIFIGARGAPDSQHIQIFLGRVDHVQSFTSTVVKIKIIRQEAVEDALLGQLVDETTYPNAPQESISRMLPIVFGTVEAHEGVVTGSARIATLVRATLATDELLVLDSSDGFPLTGLVTVNGEIMSYAGVTNDNLVAMVRGLMGTTAADIPIGAQVKLFGAFTVQFAGHPLASLSNIRALLPNGELGQLAPSPQTVDPNTAVASWSEVPAIRDPDAVPTFQRVHFSEAAPGNTAANPTSAARDSGDYGAFTTADFGNGTVLQLLANTNELGQPGDIERVWLAIIFDAGDPNNPASVPPPIVASVDGISFLVQPEDRVPQEVTRTDEKTGDRYFEITAPAVNVTPPPDEPFRIIPSRVNWPGIWASFTRAKRVVDDDLDTDAVYMFTSPVEVAFVGGGDVIFSVPDDYESPIKGDVTSAKIVYVAGWDQTPLTSHFEVYLRENGKKIPGTSFVAESVNAAGIGINAIKGRERFEHVIPPSVAAAIAPGIEWVIHPAFGVSNGLWVGVEFWIEGTSEPPAPTVDVSQESRRTVTNYLEVTDRLGLQASPGGTIVPGWDWFSDPARGGSVAFSTLFGAARIVETFYVVQFRPFLINASSNPRLFADVQGFNPDGDPVEITKTIVTNPRPLGLGLTSSSYDAAAYAEVQASLQADAVRADFAVREQRNALPLLSDLAAQADCRETWEEGKHRMIRFPRADQVAPVVRTIIDDDIFTGTSIGIGRTSLGALENVIVARWRRYDPSSDTSRAQEFSDAPSIASFGRQEVANVLSLIRDDATAALVSERKIERKSRPRWVVVFEAPLYTLNLRLGDLIAMSHRDFSFQVGEVTQVNLGARGLKRTKIQAIVWEK